MANFRSGVWNEQMNCSLQKKTKMTIYLYTKWCSISLIIKEEQIKESIFHLLDSQYFKSLLASNMVFGVGGQERVWVASTYYRKYKIA